MSLDSKKSSYKKEFGNQAEQFVSGYLKKKSFTIVEQNYQKRCGEIDIIARKKNLVIFVEVKIRKNAYFPLSEIITRSKQKKIIKTAQTFIQEQHFTDAIFRFDVALLTVNSSAEFDLNYIENAFTKLEF